jgi:RNA polymerase sigma factor (sigma-70 family)
MSVPLPRTAEPDEPLEPGDAELIQAVRSGDLEAYGLLYRRHASAAATLARQLTRSRAEADDLVAEAFAKVLDMLRTGGGPDAAFRAYLLTTLRNALYDRTRRDKRLEWSDDMSRHDPGVPWEDTAVAGLESRLAARAFQRLPERWQTVLWHTEVEQESPAEVAPLLGLTPNGVAALAYRAREGLRLGAWARGGLTPRQRVRVEKHLATCPDCRALANELEHINSGLRGVVVPLVVGTAAAAAYLAAHAAPADAAAAGGAAAGGTAAGGTAAGGAAAGGAAAGGAAAGGAAAGGAAAGGAAAGGTVGGGGSALGSMTAWVAGTHAGQAAVAAVAAVVVGGTSVAVTHDGAPDPAGVRPVATTVGSPNPPGPSESGGPAPTTVPSAGSLSPGVAPSRSSSGPTATGTPTPSTSAPTALESAPAALFAGSPRAQGALRVGSSGDVAVPIRNTGGDAARGLVVSLRLPAGITARGGSGSGGWTCTPGADTTCTLNDLGGGDQTTLHVRIAVGADAAPGGTISGTIETENGSSTPIPDGTLLVA